MESVIVKRIKALEPIVYQCMMKIPATRDDDKLLVLKIWAHQNPKLRDADFSFVMFSEGFLEGKYADPYSISRARRKVQRKSPETRGEKFEARQKEETKVRKEIND
jgi:hypothetical protein